MRNTTYDNGFITYDDDATWLVTYADLMTLLLVFFILLYTLASNEMNGYKTSLKEIQAQANEKEKMAGVMELMEKLDPEEFTLEEVTGLKTRNTELLESVRQMVRTTGQGKNISTQLKDGKIIISISGEALFKSGSAELNPDAVPVFNKMALQFNDYPDYTINIKGHTDDNPISTQLFPSNWELSAIRATNVLKFMILKGLDPSRLTATGYGEIMPKVPNINDGNRAMNRRVEFVLEKKNSKISAVDPEETDNRREAYRYVFSKRQRPSIFFKGRPVNLLNISAGGLAFKNNQFTLEDHDLIELDLDISEFGKDTPIAVRIRISRINDQGICQCRFEGLNSNQEELIHKYVLELQKKDLKYEG
ncbi:membrane protein [Desulfonema ishimotonii]|uniref:Membrane protein n=1 Tax=Desulfonema ishimotonii TaxID=45657 RepID=A0A401G4N6_9BACT|nr:OmpA family protein [Desulfonema ishimotonii]GBC64161.1 membrane protein [Desulfonema ishimotonii]